MAGRVWEFMKWSFTAVMAIICFGLLVLSFRSVFALDQVRISHRGPLPSSVDPRQDYYLRDWLHLYTSRGGLLLLNSANLWRKAEDGLPPVWAIAHESVPMQHLPPNERVYLTSDLIFENGAGARLYGLKWLGYVVAPAEGGPEDVPGFTPHPSRAVVIPLPLLVVLTATVPALWIRGHWRRRSLSRRGFAVDAAGTGESQTETAPSKAG